MGTLVEVIIFSLLGGVVSLIGGFLLLSKKDIASNLAAYATPFAAGALLAAAFVDLLREAFYSPQGETVITYVLVGILFFFLLEQFLDWFHHHHEHEDDSQDSTIPLIVIGDTMHNFIDGIAIAAGFLTSTSTGIVVTLAVAAHEIPQEIGDFGLLLHKGMERSKVLLVNFFSALATAFSAVLFYLIGQTTELSFEPLLGLVAGFFIYIATSDIIPEIHKTKETSKSVIQSALLIAGVIVVSITTTYLHQFMGDEHGHMHTEEVLH